MRGEVNHYEELLGRDGVRRELALVQREVVVREVRVLPVRDEEQRHLWREGYTTVRRGYTTVRR